MRGRITYVHHNCFVLRLGERTFLFDCPAAEHLPKRAAEALAAGIAGADLCVFVSHSHEDHFHQDLPGICAGAAQARYVLSDDVADLYPGAVPPGALVVEPDEGYDFAGLRIETLLSNDLGVAYLVEWEGLRLYYGGDLAAWTWDSASEAERAFTERFFHEALERVTRRPVDIAFSNVDGRLPNLAGGLDFVRTVRPGLFAPMHTFGRTAWLKTFAERLGPTDSQLFLYKKPGDGLDIDLPARPS